jgi:hypothetical protein
MFKKLFKSEPINKNKTVNTTDMRYSIFWKPITVKYEESNVWKKDLNLPTNK